MLLDHMARSLAEPPEPGGTAVAPAHAPSPTRPRGWLGDLWRFVARQRDLRRAVAEIEAMDERMPRDIGLDRAPRAASAGRAEAEPWRRA
jgi:uncharacterized protein YjiS (DUF1127 family)